MIAGDVILKVTPEILLAKADLITANLQKMQQTLDTLEQTAARTKDYWIGEAGELHRKMYKEQKEVIAEIMLRLKEHPADLRVIAQTYVDTEAVVTEITASLPSDMLT